MDKHNVITQLPFFGPKIGFFNTYQGMNPPIKGLHRTVGA